MPPPEYEMAPSAEAAPGAVSAAQKGRGCSAADPLQTEGKDGRFSDAVRNGFAVFDLPARSKRPDRPWKAYRDNPLDLAQAFELDATDRNVAIITGAPSGIFVLDLDSAEAERVAEERGYLIPTVIVSTGKGKHYYYKLPEDFEVKNGAGKIADHIDIRANGGFVVGAGSVHPDGRKYERISDAVVPADPPPALVDALRPTARERRSGGNNRDRSSISGEVEQLYQELRAAKDGTRNEEANRIAFRIGQLAAVGRVEADEAEQRLREICEDIGLDPGEIDHILPRAIEEGESQPRNSDGDEPRSQITMANAWCERHGHARAHNHTNGRWHRYDGESGLWRPDEKRETFHEVAGVVHEQGGGAARYSNAGFIRGTETMAAAMPGIACTHEAFDRDPLLLGTPSGPLDLTTGRRLPPDPELMITKATSIAPASGEPKKWLAFLAQSTGQDAAMIEFLQRVAGYMLTGLTIEQALFFIYGDGGNGKGVFVNTISNIMGDYAVTSAMETFTASRNERHTTELAMLHGARAVMASETEKGRAWAESRIKQLTGGDKITARFMRQDNFTFEPQFKLLIIGNFHPVLNTVDDAMRRRFNIIPFTRKPKVVNKRLEEELEAEYPQILNWMIEGCLKWREAGLERPQAVVDATADYFEEQDLFGQWLEEFCEAEPGAVAYTKDLFHSWAAFADEAKEEAGSVKGFGGMMTKRGFAPGRDSTGKRLRFWKGVRLQMVRDPATGVERPKTPRDSVGDTM